MAGSLSTRQLAAYGALGMPLTALLLPLAIFLPAYYAQLPALTTGLVGALLFGARPWKAGVTGLAVGISLFVIFDAVLGLPLPFAPAIFG